MRRTCMIDIVLSEIDGEVNIELKAEAMAADECLHRDYIPMVALEAETSHNIMARDDLLFKNLDAIENTLTVASFNNGGVNGDWFVD